jgi:hypothetical protein
MAYFTQIKGITNTVGTYTLDSTGNYKDTYPVSGSVAVSGLTGSIGATILNGEGVARDSWLVSGITNTVGVYSLDSAGNYKDTQPISGSVAVSGVTGSIGATILNGEGVSRDTWGATQVGTWNVGTVTTVTGITNTIATANIDSSGVQYSGSNPVPSKITDGTNVVSVSTAGTDGESNTANRIRVENYNDVYDAVGGTWNRVRAGQGYDGPGVLRVTHATDVRASVSVWGNTAGDGSGTAKQLLVDTDGNLQVDIMNGIAVTGSVAVTGITGSIGATILNGEGVARDSWVVSGITNTIASNLVDSSGIAYTGSNPVPVYITSGGSATTAVYNLNAEGLYRDTFPVQGTVTVGSITNTIGAALVDSSGIQYSGSNPLDIMLVTDQTASLNVSLVGSDGLGFTTSRPIPVTYVSGVSATLETRITDSAGLAYQGDNPLPVRMVTGSFGTVGVSILNGENILRDSWLVSGITASVGVSLIGSDGLAFGTTKPIPVTMVAGVSGTTGAAIVDSSGIQYSGVNPVPITIVSGASSTMNAIYTRQTNPTAVASDYVPLPADDLGRQLVRPLQVRDLIATAYASYTTGTEATLLAATAGVYNDLIWILASNNSTVAVGIDIRAVLAGNILMHLEIPANSTTGIVTPAIPLFGARADASGNAWTVDLPDITGTVVYVSALFSQEI